MRKVGLLAMACLLSWPWPCAASLVSGRGTTAATFLKIGLGPRAVAMGEAYAGVADDATAVYWNPAGLALLSAPEITASHTVWFESIYFEHLGGALPLARGVLGGSLVYLNHGTLFRSAVGDTPDSPDRGTFPATDFSLSGAYALPISESMRLGAGLKLFSENIDSNVSFGWALDCGWHYTLPWAGWTLGAVLQNLGPATKIDELYSRLPINFKAGVGWRALPELLVALDYNQLFEQDGRVGLGAEYVFEKILALRAGYRYQSAVDNNEYYEGYGSAALSGLSAGLGIRYLDLRVDYAFVPYGFLGSTHRIALTYSPSKPAATPAPTPAPTPAQTPAPTPAPTPEPAARQELQEKLTAVSRRIALGELSNVQFKSGSAELQPQSLKTLDQVGQLLAAYPDLIIAIEGHTDSQGRADDNLALSQRRVDAVKDYLVRKFALQPGVIRATGYGQTRPVATNSTKFGRSRNRRVDFKVLEGDGQ